MGIKHLTIVTSLLVTLAMTPEVQAGGHAKIVSYNNPHLQFALRFSSTLQETRCGSCNADNCVGLQRKPVSGAEGECALAIELFEESLEQTLKNRVGFKHGEHGWNDIRFGPVENHKLAGPGWHGILFSYQCQVSDGTSYHLIGNCSLAVIGSKQRSVMIRDDGSVGTQAMRSILDSFRFNRGKNSLPTRREPNNAEKIGASH